MVYELLEGYDPHGAVYAARAATREEILKERFQAMKKIQAKQTRQNLHRAGIDCLITDIQTTGFGHSYQGAGVPQ